MDLQLNGKLAFISGSTTGIGFGVALVLVKEGAKVEEIANTIAYLTSPLAVATNGTAVKLDGGSMGEIL